MKNKPIEWQEIDRLINIFDKKKKKRVEYPKGSVEEAINQVVSELGGRNENGLGEGGSK